ncbi:MAG: DUF523 domain-containing protein [Lentilitoribacter sp.]
MEKILVSACLIGRPVRYNGTDKPSEAADVLKLWQDEGRLVPICPEVSVGFPTPRPPAEIQDKGVKSAKVIDGNDVLNGDAFVFEETGVNVTELYVHAANAAVILAKKHGCRHAVLTDGSPSCGSSFIYDGSFSGVKLKGVGTTTAALRKEGITVWAEAQIRELAAQL